MMKFLKKLFAKLFGKDEKAPSTFAPTPEITPPYVSTGKFQPPEVAHPRVPAVTQPVNLNTAGWPVGTYEFKPGVYYTPYDGSNGGPFSKPAEAFAWIEAVDQRNRNSKEADEAMAKEVFVGLFPAANFILRPNEGAEAAFIYSANRMLQSKRGSQAGNLYWDFGLFSGNRDQINGLINYGEQEQLYLHKNYETTFKDFPDTPVGQAVRDVVAKRM
jgi:hypothetical protein